MGSPVRLSDLKRKLVAFGAIVEDGTKHKKAKRVVGEHTLIYVFPTEGGRRVKDLYIPKIRRKLKLTAVDGVSDDEWDKA